MEEEHESRTSRLFSGKAEEGEFFKDLEDLDIKGSISGQNPKTGEKQVTASHSTLEKQLLYYSGCCTKVGLVILVIPISNPIYITR